MPKLFGCSLCLFNTIDLITRFAWCGHGMHQVGEPMTRFALCGHGMHQVDEPITRFALCGHGMHHVLFFQTDLCTVDDIVESLRLSRIVATVVRLGTFRRITPTDYRTAHFCIFVFLSTVALLVLQKLYMM